MWYPIDPSFVGTHEGPNSVGDKGNKRRNQWNQTLLECKEPNTVEATKVSCSQWNHTLVELMEEPNVETDGTKHCRNKCCNQTEGNDQNTFLSGSLQFHIQNT